MTDIFREVDEDLRREQLKNAWNKYGIYFLALAAILVLGAGGWRTYEYFEARKAAVNGDRFLSAVELLEGNKNAEAASAFEAMGRDATGRYPGLALMASAGAKAAAGDAAGAVAGFDQAASMPSLPENLRSTAKIRAAYLLLDSATPDEIARRVGEFDTPASPFRGLAREVLGLSAWKAGDMATARRRFDEITADTGIAEGIQRRAGVMRQLINAATAAPGAPAPATPAASAPVVAPAPTPAPPPTASSPEPAPPTAPSPAPGSGGQ